MDCPLLQSAPGKFLTISRRPVTRRPFQWSMQKERETMIVRNVNDKEVLETTYRAHGGAVAQMILDRRVLQEIGFLAIARLAPGKEIEAHIDPMEEIYFVAGGTGQIRVDDETRQVGPGDATWIPVGSTHALLNNGSEDCVILVVASPI
jgi:mannose-6-phosphate isomerase-like protein (cupin superfamily)